jgi:hypothetical protein
LVEGNEYSKNSPANGKRIQNKEYDNFDHINGESKTKPSGVLINPTKYLKKSLRIEHLKN